MSVYLDCPDLDQEEPGWTLRTEFHITLVHPDDKEKSIRKRECRLIPVSSIPACGPLQVSCSAECSS